MTTIIRLSERGKISCQDAALLLARCPRHEIYSALQNANVHELRDRVLHSLRDELNRRFAV